MSKLAYILEESPGFEEIAEGIKRLDKEKFTYFKKKISNNFIDFCRLFGSAFYGQSIIIAEHHKAFIKALMLVYTGKITKLIINVQPNSHKTTFCSLLFPAYCFAHNPRARFIIGSAHQDKANGISSDLRKMVSSELFQILFHETVLSSTKYSVDRWETTRSGTFLASSMNASKIAGFRAGVMGSQKFAGALILDDPNKLDMYDSHHTQMVKDRYIDTFKSRRASNFTPTILVQQRTSESDLSGFLLDREKTPKNKKWYHVCLPAIFDPEAEIKKYKNAYLSDLRYPTSSPVDGYRSHPCYMLDAKLFDYSDAKEIINQEPNLFETQYQQNPAPQGELIFEPSHFKYFTVIPDAQIEAFITCDIAYTVKSKSDYTVMMHFIVTREGTKKKLYLNDLRRGKWLHSDAIEKLKDFSTFHRCRDIYLEKAGTGQITREQLTNDTGITPLDVDRGRNKVDRADKSLAMFELGNVYFPLKENYTRDLVTELLNFRRNGSHKHDDQVDCIVDAVNATFGGETMITDRFLIAR